jgi:hypothetical protein
MCVRGGDQRGIMTTLGLTPTRPATFALANTVVSDSTADSDGLVFVTPQLNGWTVIAGGWCDPQYDEQGEEVRHLVEQLSRQYGEAHAYSITEYGDESDWLIARAGRTVRRYSETVSTWAIGQPLPIERQHLDALGVTGSPEKMHGNEDMWEAGSCRACRPTAALHSWIGRDDARACSLQSTATPPEEVRPMNAVSKWVLPLSVTVGRLT